MSRFPHSLLALAVLTPSLLAQNPSGSVAGSAASSLQSLHGVAYADAFPGGSISQKIANAFASQAGALRSPAVSAVVYLEPHRTYNFASPIEIPNETAAPYITRPV